MGGEEEMNKVKELIKANRGMIAQTKSPTSSQCRAGNGRGKREVSAVNSKIGV